MVKTTKSKTKTKAVTPASSTVEHSIDADITTLLARCVDAKLETGSWLKLAKWLTISPTVTCHAAPMRYGALTCASKALAIFIGQDVPTLPNNPSIEMLIQSASSYKAAIRLLFDIGDDDVAAKCLILGTLPKEEGKPTGDRACLIPVKCAGTGDTAERIATMKQILNDGARKLILIVFNPQLHPKGHCIVLRKQDHQWYCSDPLMPASSCLVMPSKAAVVLLMCSARTILGI